MNQLITITIFLTIFIAIYGGLNLYVLEKIFKMLDIERKTLFYIIVAVLALSYIGANILESKLDSGLTRAIYYIASVWVGLLFILFCFIVIHDILSFFINIPGIPAAIIILNISFLLAIIGVINANNIAVTDITLSSAKIDKPINIVQISDLHLGPVNRGEFLRDIIVKVNSLNPDIVIITGDLIDGRDVYDKKDFKQLNNLKAKAFFITGNHENYAGLDLIESLLKDTNVTMLRNKLYQYKGLQFIGIDDAESPKQVYNELKNITFNDSAYTILLYHRPPGFKDAAAKGIDLMISGHTHNGQIWPFNYLSSLANGPVYGLYKQDNLYLYVTSGTGTWGPPMRLGSKNEIVKLSIYPE